MQQTPGACIKRQPPSGCSGLSGVLGRRLGGRRPRRTAMSVEQQGSALWPGGHSRGAVGKKSVSREHGLDDLVSNARWQLPRVFCEQPSREQSRVSHCLAQGGGWLRVALALPSPSLLYPIAPGEWPPGQRAEPCQHQRLALTHLLMERCAIEQKPAYPCTDSLCESVHGAGEWLRPFEPA